MHGLYFNSLTKTSQQSVTLSNILYNILVENNNFLAQFGSSYRASISFAKSLDIQPIFLSFKPLKSPEFVPSMILSKS